MPRESATSWLRIGLPAAPSQTVRPHCVFLLRPAVSTPHPTSNPSHLLQRVLLAGRQLPRPRHRLFHRPRHACCVGGREGGGGRRDFMLAGGWAGFGSTETGENG